MNIKIKPQTYEEFRIAVELRGSTMSGLIHQFIVKVIREEKDRNPEAFKVLEAEEAEVKSTSNKANLDAGLRKERTPNLDDLVIEDDVDFECDLDRRDEDGYRIHARTGKRIIDISKDEDHIARARIAVIDPKEKKGKE